MLLRRMLLLVAVLMALTAVTVAMRPPARVTDGTTTTAPPQPQASATPGDSALSPRERDVAAPGETPLQTIRADEAGQVIRLAPGDRLRLRVVADGLETVQLGTDGPIEVVDPDSPAEFEILAEPYLDADVRLLESGRTIGRVTAQP